MHGSFILLKTLGLKNEANTEMPKTVVPLMATRLPLSKACVLKLI